MNDIDLDALEATARAATPGPWIIDSLESGEHGVFIEESNPDYGSLGCASSEVAGFMVGKNAKHIAAFDPPTVLALIARLREAEAVIAEALGVVRSGSVPLGQSEARHWDRLLAESRRVLSAYLTTKTEGSER